MLANIFQDHMMIQGGRPFRVWGSARPGSSVKLELRGENAQSRTAVADGQGKFTAEFAASPSSYAAYSLTADFGGEMQEIADVLFGELFLLAGQSNMAYSMDWVDAFRIDLDGSADPGVRVLRLDEADVREGVVYRPYAPQEEISDKFRWGRAGKDSLLNFSALGYYFLRQLRCMIDRPVGAIDTSVGGCSIFSYLSREYNEREELAEYRERHDFRVDESNYNTFGAANYTQAFGIFNEKIAPLANLRFAGAAWYQGEHEAATGIGIYGTCLKFLAEMFRKQFSNPALPVFFFEIAEFLYGQPDSVLRMNTEIWKAARENGCHFVPIYDVPPDYLLEDGREGYHPIHPVTKRALGERLADMAANIVYGGGDMEPPAFVRADTKKGSTEVYFSGELQAEAKPFGFYVWDEEGTFFPVTARIAAGNCVRLLHRGRRIAGLGYAYFPNNYEANLKGENGLPAVPFVWGEGRTYLPCLPLLLKYDEVANISGASEWGGFAKKPAWKNGELFTSAKAKVKVANGKPQIAFQRDNASFFYFGLSPELAVANSLPELERYDELRLTISCSVGGAQFVGLHVLDARGNLWLCSPEGLKADTLLLPLEQGANEIVVPLKPVNGGWLAAPEGALENAREIQLTFRAFAPGRLKLTELELVKKTND